MGYLKCLKATNKKWGVFSFYQGWVIFSPEGQVRSFTHISNSHHQRLNKWKNWFFDIIEFKRIRENPWSQLGIYHYFQKFEKKITHADCELSKHPNLQTNVNPEGWHVKREDHHPMWFFWLRIIYRSKETTTQHWLAFFLNFWLWVRGPQKSISIKPKTSNSVKSVLEIHVSRIIGYHKTSGIFGYPFWPLEYNPECRVFAYSNIHSSFCARAGANTAQ